MMNDILFCSHFTSRQNWNEVSKWCPHGYRLTWEKRYRKQVRMIKMIGCLYIHWFTSLFFSSFSDLNTSGRYVRAESNKKKWDELSIILIGLSLFRRTYRFEISEWDFRFAVCQLSSASWNRNCCPYDVQHTHHIIFFSM